MTDYQTSVSLQDPLLERPLYETSSTPAKAIPIPTRYGYVLVTQQGPPDRNVIVTYHDVGYNCTSLDFFERKNRRASVLIFSFDAISPFLCFE